MQKTIQRHLHLYGLHPKGNDFSISPTESNGIDYEHFIFKRGRRSGHFVKFEHALDKDGVCKLFDVRGKGNIVKVEGAELILEGVAPFRASCLFKFSPSGGTGGGADIFFCFFHYLISQW